MSLWGYGDNLLSPFCYGCLESRDHLFFSCSFSGRVWKRVIATCFIRYPKQAWEDIAEWSSSALKGKSLWNTLCRLCLDASIYHIWRQRNDLLHGNVPRSEEQIIAQIIWEVKTNILASSSFKDTVFNQRLIQEWNLYRVGKSGVLCRKKPLLPVSNGRLGLE